MKEAEKGGDHGNDYSEKERVASFWELDEGRSSASVTILWLLVPLTLLLRLISKRLLVKPVMTLSHARLDRASHYLKFTETSFGCLCFFAGAGVGACSYLKRSDVPKKH